MKYFNKCFFLLVAFYLFSTPNETKACVDYHNDSVFVIVHYDSTFSPNTDVSITLSNLQLFGGSPNQFCSCGVNSITNIFSDILYVAFVDSGTTNPVAGFDVWDASANASNAWAGVVASGNWSGFVAQVNGNGLTPGGKVELLIRARLPVGYTFAFMDTTLTVMKMGTDEWFDSQQTLGNTHQSVSGVEYGFQYISEGQNSTYFADLDAAYLTGRKDPESLLGLQLFPVPAMDKVYVRLNNPSNAIKELQLLDAAGRVLQSHSGLSGQQTQLDLADLPNGLYFIKVSSALGTETKRILK